MRPVTTINVMVTGSDNEIIVDIEPMRITGIIITDPINLERNVIRFSVLHTGQIMGR